MIGSLTFLIAHLAIVLAVMGGAIASKRRARTEPERNRRRPARYRRLSSDDVLKLLAQRGK